MEPDNSEENKMLWAEIAFKRAFLRSKRREFNLELWDIETPELCPALLTPLCYDPRFRAIPGSRRARAFIPALCRLDHSRGYIKGNIITMSVTANSIQHRQPHARFLASARLLEFRRWILDPSSPEPAAWMPPWRE